MTVSEKFSVLFSGDSGDGIQLIGEQFTFVCVKEGWEVQTQPDFPAEIRAPLGTLSGVSGFQLSAAQKNLHTLEDKVDVLIALNPAALKHSLPYLKKSGVLLYNEDQFKAKDLLKAGYSEHTLDDILPNHVSCHSLAITTQTLATLAESELAHSDKKKAKNFYALGLVHWLFQIPLAPTLTLIETKFSKKPLVKEANQSVLKAGYNFAITIELPHLIENQQAQEEKNSQLSFISGIKAVSLALAFLSVRTKVPLLVAGYPITPASNILHDAARLEKFGVSLFQAEDEIAAACAALGASFAGLLALTCTSGPGLDLKAETLGLAVMTEFPMVVIDVQRSGPSTGLPTKTEQSDLLMAVYGRHGEAPLPVIAASSPSDVFYTVIDAFKIAIQFMTPVILLLDSHIANGSERWEKPDFKAVPFPDITFATKGAPYDRNSELSRPWIKPGTPNLMHRLGGLEKGNAQGAVTYDAKEHQEMIELRQKKVESITMDLPWLHAGPKEGGLVIVSWGSTYGVITEVVQQLEEEGIVIAHIHLRQLFPLQASLKVLLSAYQQVYVAELNQGQLLRLLRDKFLIDAQLIGQTNGQPFKISHLKEKVREAL